MDIFYSLDQIQPSHRRLVGDQAFYLGLLAQRGYPIAPGLLISTIALQEFLETIDWLAPLFADFPHSSLHLDVDNPRQLQAIARQIRQAIEAAVLPADWGMQVAAIGQGWNCKALMLRPSLVVQSSLDPLLSSKTSGLLEAQTCWVEAEAIGTGLKRLWGQLFRAKSLLYWQRSGIPLQQIGLAVLVQPLASAASGEMRVEKNIEVRATWGLGQALTNGEAVPDLYQVDAQTQLVRRQLGSKTHAYRVGMAECLEFYAVESAQQNQFVLTAEQLEKLIGWGRQACSEVIPGRSQTLHLEWMLTGSALSITQVMVQPDSLLPARTEAEPSKPLLAGLAAASGRSIAPAWIVRAPKSAIPPGMILVADSISPDWLSDVKQAAGLILEQGGMTSHGALLARELGIPAVVGAAKAMQAIQTGEIVLLDGDRGEVYRAEVHHAEIHRAEIHPVHPSNAQPSAAKAVTQREKPNATQLMVNLSQPDRLSEVAALPIDGVGLLRSELLLMDLLQSNLSIDRIAERILLFAQAFAPRPVFYRSLDLRPEYRRSSSPEPNPMLGLHGALSYQSDPTLFQLELAALRQVQQSGYANVHLLLPFVRTVEEFRFCRDLVIQAGLMQPQFQLWIMAEVPSVLFLLPEYVAAGVQGISIGSNDLTQLLLGVDRDHPQMAEAYNQRHPAVLRAIQQLIETARRENIPCSICGQAPSQYPDLIASLVRWGITSISVEPEALAQTERAMLLCNADAIEQAKRSMLLDTARIVET